MRTPNENRSNIQEASEIFTTPSRVEYQKKIEIQILKQHLKLPPLLEELSQAHIKKGYRTHQ